MRIPRRTTRQQQKLENFQTILYPVRPSVPRTNDGTNPAPTSDIVHSAPSPLNRGPPYYPFHLQHTTSTSYRAYTSTPVGEDVAARANLEHGADRAGGRLPVFLSLFTSLQYISAADGGTVHPICPADSAVHRDGFLEPVERAIFSGELPRVGQQRRESALPRILSGERLKRTSSQRRCS